MNIFGFGNSSKCESNSKSNGNGGKNKRRNYNNSSNSNNNSRSSNNNTGSHAQQPQPQPPQPQTQAQAQIYKQGQTQEKIVLHTKMVLDQLQNCLEMFGSFVPAVTTKKNKRGKKIGFSEMQARNSAVVASINIFGSMCVDLQEHKNVRGLDIASHKLYDYVQGLGNVELEILKPFLEYMNCAANGVEVPVLPAIEVDAKQWNSKNVNSMFSGLLGSGHVIEKRHDEYRQNVQEIDQQLDQEWKRNGKKSANISSGNGTGNSTHLPDADSMFRFSGANVKLSHGFKNNQYGNAPLQAQLECQGEHDYDYEQVNAQPQPQPQNASVKSNVSFSASDICDEEDDEDVEDEDDAGLAVWLVSIGFKAKKGKLYAMTRALSTMGIDDFDELKDSLFSIYQNSAGKLEKSWMGEMENALSQRGILMAQRIAFLKAAEILIGNQQNQNNNYQQNNENLNNQNNQDSGMNYNN